MSAEQVMEIMKEAMLVAFEIAGPLLIISCLLYTSYAISSRMAELTIIDTIYTGVALRLGDKAIANFEALERALVVKKY